MQDNGLERTLVRSLLATFKANDYYWLRQPAQPLIAPPGSVQSHRPGYDATIEPHYREPQLRSTNRWFIRIFASKYEKSTFNFILGRLN